MINYKNLELHKLAIQHQFQNSSGVRRFIIDGFLEERLVRDLSELHEQTIAASGKNPNAPKKHLHVAKKLGIHRTEIMAPLQREFFREISNEKFINLLREVTGISPIYADPDLEGGGLHQIFKDGFLNVHTDFNFHPKNRNWHRRLNILFYLNIGWRKEWKGNLEIYNEDLTKVIASIEPIANRVVVFETSEISFHGHPEPLLCPIDVTRKSMAAYFYTDWPIGLEHRHKTNYKLVHWQKTAILEEIKKSRILGIRDHEIRNELCKRYDLVSLKELTPVLFQ